MSSKSTAVAKTKRAQVALPADTQAKFQAEVEAMQKRLAAPSGDKIMVTQSKMFRLPDGRESPGPIQAVIVDFVSYNTYYDANYSKDTYVPPKCFALGIEPAGLEPSKAAIEPQSDTCASCWANQFGTDPNGGKGKACQNTRMLALLDHRGDESTPLMLLKVSSTALRSFDSYIGNIARSFKVPPRGVLTEISFAEELDYPSLRFGNPTKLDPELLALADSRQEEALKRLLTEPEFKEPTEAPARNVRPRPQPARKAIPAPKAAAKSAKPAAAKR